MEAIEITEIEKIAKALTDLGFKAKIKNGFLIVEIHIMDTAIQFGTIYPNQVISQFYQMAYDRGLYDTTKRLERCYYCKKWGKRKNDNWPGNCYDYKSLGGFGCVNFTKK